MPNDDTIKKAIAAIRSGVSPDDAVKMVTSTVDEDHAEGQDLYLTQAFFIRCLEWAREMAKDDVSLHKFAEAVFSKSHPDGSKEGSVVRSKDFDGLLKQSNETTGAGAVGGFMGGVGPSKSYPVGKKKKDKKKGTNESADGVLSEFYDRESPCVRVELDCLEHALTVAGEKQFNKEKARDVTNAIARKTAGTYSALTKYDFKEAMQSLETENDDD